MQTTTTVHYRDELILEAHEDVDHHGPVKILVSSINHLRVSDLAVLRVVHAELGRLLEVSHDAPTRDDVREMVRSEVTRQLTASVIAGLREMRASAGPY